MQWIDERGSTWVLSKPNYGWDIFHYHPAEYMDWVPVTGNPHPTCICCGEKPPKHMLVAYTLLNMGSRRRDA
jgi:hypothetical protein